MIDKQKKTGREVSLSLILTLLQRSASRRPMQYAIFCVAVAFTAAATVALPYVLSQLVTFLNAGIDPSELLAVCVIYAALFGIANGMQRALMYVSQIFESDINFEASIYLVSCVIRKKHTFFFAHNPAEIQAAIQNSQNAARTILNLICTTVFPVAAQFGFSLYLLAGEISWNVAATVAAYGAFVVWLTLYSIKKTQSFLDQSNEMYRKSAKQLGNTVLSIDAIQLFNAEKWTLNRFSETSELIRGTWQTWARRQAYFSSAFAVGLALQLLINFLFILPKFQDGQLNLGEFILFNGLVIQLNRPFELLGTAAGRIAQAISMLEPGANLTKPDGYSDQEGIGTGPSRVSGRSFVFKSVTFKYDQSERAILHNVTFRASLGTMTFVVGGSGVGKSTIMKLALKYLEPLQGSIHLDELNLADVSRTTWLRSVSFVPQDTLLFDSTIFDNVAMGRNVTESEVNNALARAAIKSKVESLPDGLRTEVGERGLKLSGGERQRIAIARALLSDPIILFLDEASSALDEKTEGEIFRELRQLSKTTIIIAVTHRRGIINSEDNIVQLPDTHAHAIEKKSTLGS